jgi:hypothetical protein
MKTASGSSGNGNFVAFPRGLYTGFSHELTPAAWCVLSLIYFQVDFKTGFWDGSADKIVAGWAGRLGVKRTVLRTLDLLENLGYIKRFHVPGTRGNYPVAIEGYVVRSGPFSGLVLNAAETTDPDHAVYAKAKGQNGKKVSLIKRKTCHRGMDRKPKRDAEFSGPDKKRVTDKQGVRGQYVSRIQDIQDNNNSNVADGGDDGKFLAEVYAVLEAHGASSVANRDHQRRTLALAAEHGPQKFLRALDLWLVEEGATWQKAARRHALAHFISPGRCEHYINRLDGQAATAVDDQRRQQEADATRKRQAVKDELIREEDAAGREFAAWQSQEGTADGFVPANPGAFERYVVRERVKDWTQDSGESWGDLDTQRQAGLAAAIDARMAEVSA